MLRAHGDALAVALHHDHVGSRQVLLRVPGPLLIEVVRPGGQVLGQAGELGAADSHAGAGLDDLLGLPEPARRLMITCDGAGASHALVKELDRLAARHGYQVTYSVGWELGARESARQAPEASRRRLTDLQAQCHSGRERRSGLAGG